MARDDDGGVEGGSDDDGVAEGGYEGSGDDDDGGVEGGSDDDGVAEGGYEGGGDDDDGGGGGCWTVGLGPCAAAAPLGSDRPAMGGLWVSSGMWVGCRVSGACSAIRRRRRARRA